PESGSFACFLLEEYGVDRFKKIYTKSNFEAALKEIYRTTLSSLEKKWLKMLEAL
ncbi:MAG: hypothetical protein IT330_08545, partial [Anaerolineae bacterium]|nr:hypothetical protein [Anaerolineae bacterium]